MHAAGDDGNLYSYLPRVEKFHGWAVEEEDKDFTMPDYLAWQCYHCDADVSLGKDTLSGFLHVMPGMGGSMPHSARALKAWAKLRVAREREPIVEEVIMMVIFMALCEGEIWEALGYMLHYDCLLRGQDLEQLDIADISVGQEEVALTLGDPERGGSVKGGTDQGVLVDRQLIRRILRRLKQKEPKHRKVFRMRMHRYRSKFKTRLQQNGQSPDDGPHRLRHSGAANDLRKKIRDLEALRKRGRWVDITSVNIYAREHLWVRSEERTPVLVLNHGRSLMDNAERIADVWLRIYEDPCSADPFDTKDKGRPATAAEVAYLRPSDGSLDSV